MRSLLSAFLLLCVVAGPGSAVAGLPIVIQRVGDRTVVANYLSNNVVAIATERGVIVVDSHRSPSIMVEIVAAMVESLGRDDFKWLVNTHGHWDHSWGNQALTGVVGMGHELCAVNIDGYAARARLEVLRREMELSRLVAELDTLAADSPRREGTRVRAEAMGIIVDDLHHRFVPTPPQETFADRARIDGGDATAELIFCGWAHTDHDVLVYIPEEDILMTGDVFCSSNAPCFAVNALTDVPRLIAVLDDILERSPTELVVLPGHGGVMTRSDLVKLRAVTEARYAGVRADASAARRLALGRSLADSGQELYFDENEFHVLARRYLGRGRLDQALDALEIAIERLPESALLHDILGETHFHMGNVAGAITHYERSLELDPYNRNAADMLAIIRAGN